MSWTRGIMFFVFLVGIIALGASPGFAEMGGDDRIDKTDSCYFVMTDRFFNGDPSNDDQGFGEFNPSDPRAYHGGDWKGLKEKLPYIAGMRFTCLYITPGVDNSKAAAGGSRSYHGYHAFDFTKPNRNFGTFDDLRALVDAAHGLNMEVMIDQVYNHMSPTKTINCNSYPAFKCNEFHNCGRQGEQTCPISGTCLRCDENTTRDLAGLADLRTDLDSVREKLATQHTDYYNFVNADAMRLNSVKHLDPSDWGGLTALIRDKIPGDAREFMLGEVFKLDGSDEEIASQIGAFTKPPANISSVLNFLLYRAIKDFQDNDAGKLGSVRYSQLTQGHFADPFSLGNFVDNHDLNRFLCDHQNNFDKLKQALYVAFTWPGFPIMYYGTEQGARGCKDPENREDMSALGFNQDGDLYIHVARLNTVRNSRENLIGNGEQLTFTNGNAGRAIRNGTLQERFVNRCLYAFERKTPNATEVALVMLNACGTRQEMTNLQTDIGSGRKRETTYGTKFITPNAQGTVASFFLEPFETLIFENS